LRDVLVVPNMLNVHIMRINGDSVELGPVHPEESVATVKEMVAEQLGIPPLAQRLSALSGGEPLKDTLLCKDIKGMCASAAGAGVAASGAASVAASVAASDTNAQLSLLLVESDVQAGQCRGNWAANDFDDMQWGAVTRGTCCCCTGIQNFMPTHFLAQFGWWRLGTSVWCNSHKYTFFRIVGDRGGEAKLEEALQGVARRHKVDVVI
jgi:hypothetical protein